MIKTFIAGVVLGVAGIVAVLYFFPTVDQHREASIISVTPNRGNAEVFHVNVPIDRIMLGAPENGKPVPESLEWPDNSIFEGTSAEIFKLRNSRNAVIGVASRLAASDDEIGDVIEWVLHLPARGSLFVAMQADAIDGADRVGRLTAGTREFQNMSGQTTERWVANAANADDGLTGRIELAMTFIAKAEEQPDEVTE